MNDLSFIDFNKQRILAVVPTITEDSGIYVFIREEQGFKFAYVGQAKHLLTRVAQHLSDYNYIDNSIRKHGLYSDENVTGWKILFELFPESKLNQAERDYIRRYADLGYQLRNKLSGGQDAGRFRISECKPIKNYYDGLIKGYDRARKEIAHLFDLHLDVVTKSNKPNKIQQRALQKFYKFIEKR